MNEIIRSPTDQERRTMIPIVDPAKKEKSVLEKFNEELSRRMLECNKKGLPFCDKAARDDFNDYWKNEAQLNVRKNGYLKPEEIKPIEMNWEKYSDLNNFDVVEDGETFDEYLTKKNPGLEVFAKKKVYQFKGYSNKYTLMEDGPSSIRRARQKLKDLESDTTK